MKKNQELKFILALSIFLFLFSFSFAYFLGFGKFTKSFGMNDFRFFYIAILVMLKGLNPYEPENLNYFAESLNLESNLFSVYPPFTYVLFFPFGFISPSMASLFWFSLNVVLIYLSSIISFRLIGCEKMRTKKGVFINHFLPFVIFIIHPMVLLGLELGQMNMIITFSLAMVLLGIKKDNFILIGVFLGLSALKPTSSLIFDLVVFFYLLYNKKFITFVYS